METVMGKSQKAVGVVVREKSAAAVADKTLSGARGVTVRVITTGSYLKASKAANSSLRTSIAGTKTR
jgi:hypothetical protein